MSITIPTRTSAATHCTSGLTGFPALDLFGDLGEDVHIGVGGTVVSPHLIPWRQGFGGWTFYFNADDQSRYFVTHLDESFEVRPGRLEAGALIGRLTRSAAHAAMINGAHVHVGNTFYTGPGLQCGTPPPPPGTTAAPPKPFGTTPTSRPPAKHRTTRLHLPEGVTPPGTGLKRTGNVLHNWKYLTNAIGRTMPTNDVHVRAVRHKLRRVFAPRVR